MDFHEILYFRIFRKSVKKIKVTLKSDSNERHFIGITINMHDNFHIRTVLQHLDINKVLFIHQLIH